MLFLGPSSYSSKHWGSCEWFGLHPLNLSPSLGHSHSWHRATAPSAKPWPVLPCALGVGECCRGRSACWDIWVSDVSFLKGEKLVCSLPAWIQPAACRKTWVLGLRDRTEELVLPDLPPCQRICRCIDASLPVAMPWMIGSSRQEGCWETVSFEEGPSEKRQKWGPVGHRSSIFKAQVMALSVLFSLAHSADSAELLGFLASLQAIERKSELGSVCTSLSQCVT